LKIKGKSRLVKARIGIIEEFRILIGLSKEAGEDG
jgi:hypothetical protein